MGKVCTPGMAETLACTSGRIWKALRLRSSQGLRPSPQNPPVGVVIWKVKLVSGMVVISWCIARVDRVS